jgi:hypothetical protein
LKRRPFGALVAGPYPRAKAADGNSDTGIEPNTCIDSKASIAVKSCIARKKVFDTIAVKDS